MARNGKPVAKIIPWPPPRTSRVAGAWADQVEYPLDEMGPDAAVVSLFEESAEAERA